MKTIVLLTGSCVAVLACTGCGRVGSGYQKSGGQWSYVAMSGDGPRATNLGVDSETFIIFDTHGYAKDKQTVWYSGQRTRDADAASFKALPEPSFGRDNSHVFVRGHVIPGADPKSFVVIKGPYGRDNSSLFCGNIKMDVTDIDLFEVVTDTIMWKESKNKEFFVFQYGEEFADLTVSDENPAILAETWGRDGSYYYYGPARVEGADYHTFQTEGNFGGARDKNREFSGCFSVDEWPSRRQKFLGIQ